ncbi:MAG TPA: threonine/serine dehydratase [Candidatus Angelobacter sp.]|nr:threonine/serine dehydratase [Candidatus Angelobacter sp.]
MSHGARPTLPEAIANLSAQVTEAADRIQPVVVETPVEQIVGLISDNGSEVFFKLENLQKTGSFKLRGASNKILSLSPKEAANGVIAASNGNHGLGVAAAAKTARIAAEVYVSNHVSPSKARRIEEYGVQIKRVGNDPLEAELAARAAASEQNKIFISPYNDVQVMAGQGTIAVELLRQLPPLDAVFVAVGGGGLIGGIGAHMKFTSPKTEVVGCWPENSPVLYESIKAGRILDVTEEPTLSESTAGGLEPGSVTLDVCSYVIDSAVLVSETEILDAMRKVRALKGWIIEGAAAAAVAGFIKTAKRYSGKRVAVVICGANISEKVLSALG